MTLVVQEGKHGERVVGYKLMDGVKSQLVAKAHVIGAARRIVVKIGSSVLSDGAGLHRRRVQQISKALSALQGAGKQVVVVTSGAVAAVIARLQVKRSGRTIPVKQAAAAVGQISLMALYQECFLHHNLKVAQILLTHDDLSNRRRYLNAKHTILALIEAGVVPIVNENDTVAVEEIQFGDNDNLSSQVAVLTEADALIMFSDVDGLYEKDPRLDGQAKLISLVERFDARLMDLGGKPGPLGRGGMASKIEAAQKAAMFGIPTLLTNGCTVDGPMAAFDTRTEVGTLFLATGDKIASRKHWIAYTLKPTGTVTLAAGATAAILKDGKSLLPAGVQAVEGAFGEGDCITCLDENGNEFARGLVNYNAADLKRIRGVQTRDIERTLGYKISDEVIHRNDLALIQSNN